MPQSLGHDAVLGFVTQASAGSLTTRTKFLDFISSTLKGDRQHAQSSLLGSSSRRQSVEVANRSAGAIDLEGNFEGIDTLFKHAFGAVASAQQGLTTAYLHTFTRASALPSPGMSMEIKKGLVQAFAYEGCKVNSITFRQDPNDYLRISVDIVGRGETKVSATTPTFPSDLPIHQSQFAFTIDAGATTVNNFFVTLNNALAGDRPQIGSVLPKEAIRNGIVDVSGGFELDFEDTAQYDKWVTHAAVALVATWTGGVIEGAENYLARLTLPAAKYQGTPPDVPGRGPITVPFTFTGYEQTRGAMDELKLEVKNTATAGA